ncbi:hypothetical protein [Variovorax sp. RHLX14]|uniref:hypothetical protein n=1 Tax=Variovorax sp. RHLX14 TaxID=1259731 RepID=UPI003F498752
MSNTASISPALSIKNPSKSETPAADAAFNKPTFKRSNIESGKDQMYGGVHRHHQVKPTGRDFVARQALETTCQQLHTRMNEGALDVLGFAHQGQHGIAHHNEKSEPVLSVQLGAQPGVLTISSMADISYMGKPLVRLSSEELHDATHLASSVLKADIKVNRF